MKIRWQAIEVDNFKAFGTVLKKPVHEPTAQGDTFKYWSDIVNYKIDGDTEIGLCTVYKDDSKPLKTVERHLYTPEILIPVDAPFVLPVVTDHDTVHAFKVNIGEAVIIDPGVWHGPCLPVGKNESTYYVIFRKGTPGDDVEKKDISGVMIYI